MFSRNAGGDGRDCRGNEIYSPFRPEIGNNEAQHHRSTFFKPDMPDRLRRFLEDVEDLPPKLRLNSPDPDKINSLLREFDDKFHGSKITVEPQGNWMIEKGELKVESAEDKAEGDENQSKAADTKLVRAVRARGLLKHFAKMLTKS